MVLGGSPSGPLEGNKVLDGGAGEDFLGGGLDSDVLRGGTGEDTMFGGDEGRHPASDVFFGALGNDTISPFNIPKDSDTVSCGGGKDVVYADRLDVIAADCERVRLRPPSGI